MYAPGDAGGLLLLVGDFVGEKKRKRGSEKMKDAIYPRRRNRCLEKGR